MILVEIKKSKSNIFIRLEVQQISSIWDIKHYIKVKPFKDALFNQVVLFSFTSFSTLRTLLTTKLIYKKWQLICTLYKNYNKKNATNILMNNSIFTRFSCSLL